MPIHFPRIAFFSILFWIMATCGLCLGEKPYEPKNIFIFGEFLYLGVSEEGLYANNKPVGLASSPGFKAGISINYDHDGWDSLFSYSAVHPEKHGSGYTWSLNFQSLSIQLGRTCKLSPYLDLRYFIGIKGGWQKEMLQNLSLNDQKTWGAGMTQGLNALFSLNKHFAIYGNSEIAALWTRFHVQTNNKLVDSDFHMVAPMMGFGTGLSWKYAPLSEEWSLNLALGWQIEIWNNHVQMGTIPGDLGLQGVRLALEVKF